MESDYWSDVRQGIKIMHWRWQGLKYFSREPNSNVPHLTLSPELDSEDRRAIALRRWSSRLFHPFVAFRKAWDEPDHGWSGFEVVSFDGLRMELVHVHYIVPCESQLQMLVKGIDAT